MRTLSKYEVKLGHNRITLPSDYVLIGAAIHEDKAWILAEVETKNTDFVDIPFQVMKAGEVMDEKLIVEKVACGVLGADVVVVWEVL